MSKDESSASAWPTASAPDSAREPYPWSESGKELLLAFKMLIKQYGGSERLANAIEVEWMIERVSKHKNRPWTPDEEQFASKNAGQLSLSQIAARINRSPNAVYCKIIALTRKKTKHLT